MVGRKDDPHEVTLYLFNQQSSEICHHLNALKENIKHINNKYENTVNPFLIPTSEVRSNDRN